MSAGAKLLDVFLDVARGPDDVASASTLALRLYRARQTGTADRLLRWAWAHQSPRDAAIDRIDVAGIRRDAAAARSALADAGPLGELDAAASVARAHAVIGDDRAASRVLADAGDEASSAAEWTVEVYAEAGNVKRTRELARLAYPGDRPYPRRRRADLEIQALRAAGKLADARRLVRGEVRRVLEVKKVDVVRAVALLHACIELELEREGMHLARAVAGRPAGKNYDPDDADIDVVRFLREHGERELADRAFKTWLDAMKRTIEHGAAPDVTALILPDIMLAHLDLGEVATARALMPELLAAKAADSDKSPAAREIVMWLRLGEVALAIDQLTAAAKGPGLAGISAHLRDAIVYCLEQRVRATPAITAAIGRLQAALGRGA